jgi:hypothetical protein
MKHCQKMKQRLRAHLGSMGTKRDMTQQHGDVGQRRDGTREEKGSRRCHLADANSYQAKK